MAISIHLNGELRELAGEVTLDRLIEDFALPNQRVAVELNERVVRRADWPATFVRDADKIEVVHFVGGG
jgi:thiamine biosynthesis protein ThiS